MKIFHDILTEVNGHTYDISKLLWMLGVVVYLVLSVLAVIKGQAWNPGEYGVGMGAVLAGGGIALKFTKGEHEGKSHHREVEKETETAPTLS